MTIVNVSVPSISGSLGVTTSEGTWAVSSYMLAAAVMQPLSGWIARRFGEVRTFVTSILLFMILSAICGLATSLPMLVGARLIQGLVSGPMMSVAQAILLRNYPIERRGMALGLWSMVIMIAPIFGPIIGGWITDNFSWPWLFYINLPVGAFSAAASWSILRHPRIEDHQIADRRRGSGTSHHRRGQPAIHCWTTAMRRTGSILPLFWPPPSRRSSQSHSSFPGNSPTSIRSWICACLAGVIFASVP